MWIYPILWLLHVPRRFQTWKHEKRKQLRLRLTNIQIQLTNISIPLTTKSNIKQIGPKDLRCMFSHGACRPCPAWKKATSFSGVFLHGLFTPHTIHVWYIYLHWPYFPIKNNQMYVNIPVPWMIICTSITKSQLPTWHPTRLLSKPMRRPVSLIDVVRNAIQSPMHPSWRPTLPSFRSLLYRNLLTWVQDPAQGEEEHKLWYLAVLQGLKSQQTLDINPRRRRGKSPEVWYDWTPKNIPKTANLRRYDWMSRDFCLHPKSPKVDG